MSIEKQLEKRSQNCCELCNSNDRLSPYHIPKIETNGLESVLHVCDICLEKVATTDALNANHWRCLNDSMWSEHNAVKIMVWRLLKRLHTEDWSKDLLDMMYLEDDILQLAKASGDDQDSTQQLIHRDVNGVKLEAGDNIVLIKDLKVKGSSMVAKQGTAVRSIKLDHENENYIEGKVNGQHIVIITQYVKKS